MIFLGNPGTGKTTVARLIAQTFRELHVMKKGHLVCATRKDLVAPYHGQTAGKTTDVFMSALDGVLFIDEAYSLQRECSAGEKGDSYGHEVLDTLNELMTTYAGRCCVILAGYREEMERMLEVSNPGLRERFPFRIEFEDFTADELTQIFMQKASAGGLRFDDDCKSLIQEEFTRRCADKSPHFANGRIAENLLQEVVLQQELRLFERYFAGANTAGEPVLDRVAHSCESLVQAELTADELFTLQSSDFMAAISTLNVTKETSIKRKPIGFQARRHVA